MSPMRLLPAAAAILLAACGSTPVPEVRYYSLAPATGVEAAAEPVLALPIRVEIFSADGLHSEQGVLYANSEGGPVRTYHYQLWNDTPGALLQKRLIARLRAANYSSRGGLAPAGPGRRVPHHRRRAGLRARARCRRQLAGRDPPRVARGRRRIRAAGGAEDLRRRACRRIRTACRPRCAPSRPASTTSTPASSPTSPSRAHERDAGHAAARTPAPPAGVHGHRALRATRGAGSAGRSDAGGRARRGCALLAPRRGARGGVAALLLRLDGDARALVARHGRLIDHVVAALGIERAKVRIDHGGDAPATVPLLCLGGAPGDHPRAILGPPLATLAASGPAKAALWRALRRARAGIGRR